jgi:hypothetical protein
MRAAPICLLGLALLAAPAPARADKSTTEFHPPAPPAPEAGGIQVYPDGLAAERVAEVKQRLRSIGPTILAEYRSYAAANPSGLADGMLQVGIAIDRDGRVKEVKRIHSQVGDELARRVERVVQGTTFGSGTEAYAYYTISFSPRPFEVLRIAPDFTAKPPVVVAEVENRSGFDFPAVSVTVSVLGPESAKPLRVFRRRLESAFRAGERREIRVPVGSEWASGRNSYLVEIDPTGPGDPLEKPR